MLCCVSLCCAALHCAVLCSPVLCCAPLCCAVLCCASLCFASLCFAELRCSLHSYLHLLKRVHVIHLLRTTWLVWTTYEMPSQLVHVVAARGKATKRPLICSLFCCKASSFLCPFLNETFGVVTGCSGQTFMLSYPTPREQADPAVQGLQQRSPPLLPLLRQMAYHNQGQAMIPPNSRRWHIASTVVYRLQHSSHSLDLHWLQLWSLEALPKAPASLSGVC